MTIGFPLLTSNSLLLGLGALLLISSVVIFSSGQRQADAILRRLNFHRRRTAAASTPPRSVSPSEKDPGDGEKKSPLSPSIPNYAQVFPPSRRCALAEAGLISVSANTDVALDTLKQEQLSTTRSYRHEEDILKYTPTSLSTFEVKALGNFPTYDILSGVPLPKAYEGFDPARALPRPYRPLRWAYHQTMSLTKMEPDWWLEVENTYQSRIKQRTELFEQHGNMVLDYLPGSELACKELMEMCIQFYCARYPNLFSLSADKRTFHNAILATVTDLTLVHPLHVLLQNVPEDFAVVLRNENDGMYYFRAGLICSSLGWNVSTKIGMQLSEIHQPIPDYKEKMAFSMDRYFSKMPTNMPIQRGSWGIETGTPLFMPPGDPHEKLREIQRPDLRVEECHFRIDWQTLRRLPLSGAIIFNFKALFTAVPELRDEAYVPSLVLKILKEGKRSMMEYKSTWHVEHVCIPALEEYEKEQIAKGLVKPERADQDKWEVATLAESPFFPGWEEKWHRQQGF